MQLSWCCPNSVPTCTMEPWFIDVNHFIPWPLISDGGKIEKVLLLSQFQAGSWPARDGWYLTRGSFQWNIELGWSSLSLSIIVNTETEELCLPVSPSSLNILTFSNSHHTSHSRCDCEGQGRGGGRVSSLTVSVVSHCVCKVCPLLTLHI